MNKFPGIKYFILQSILFISFASTSQGVPGDVEKKFIDYSSQHPAENIFVHTDKEFYLAGEIVWFKLYLTTKNKLSKLAYVDILDATNKTVLNTKVSLKEHENNGSLLLPLSLNTGSFKLRAYTNWMKNEADNSFFEKTITIINPFKSPNSISQKRIEEYVINFFPEGGNLVAGLQSKVGFKIVDKYGRGVNCKGNVLNSKNEIVTTFETYKFGIGSFIFTPSAETYTATVTMPDGNIITKTLPAAYKNGYVMSVTETGDNINIQLTSAFTGPQNIYLFVRDGKNSSTFSQKEVEDQKAVFTLSKSKLGKGIIQFTAFNNIGKPVCERLYFIKPEKQSLAIATNAGSYTTRQKVLSGINTKNSNGQPIGSDLSVSVFPLDSVQILNSGDIQSSFWFSDLNGNIESPDFYFSDAEGTEQATDNLMLTQGWRRFNWNNILANKNNSFEYLPEYNGHLVSIKVTDILSANPVADKEVFLSIPGKPYSFLTALSNEKGIASFEVKELYGLKKMIFQVNDPKAELYKIELISPFYTSATTSTSPFYLPDQKNLLEKYSINMQVQNIYNADSMRIFYAPQEIDTTPFYKKGFYAYNLDDYTRFTTMEEVLREYVREINVGARNGKLYLKILDEPRKEYNEDNLLVLWDGVPLQDPHSIFKHDPLKVKRLEIIPRRYAAGETLYKGIASFTTYNNDLAGFTITPNMLAIDYDGMQLQREFYSPSYETAEKKNSRMPDFRNTLYWSPNVVTNAKGEAQISFYTGDRKGKYIGIVQGLTEDGQPVVGSFNFEVK